MEEEKNIEKLSFDDLNLKENLLRGIYSYGFENPSKIQHKSIPHLTSGKDLIAQAQSGTGKTGAFSIGCLNKINEDEIMLFIDKSLNDMNFKKKLKLNFEEIEIKNTNELMWGHIKNAK